MKSLHCYLPPSMSRHAPSCSHPARPPCRHPVAGIDCSKVGVSTILYTTSTGGNALSPWGVFRLTNAPKSAIVIRPPNRLKRYVFGRKKSTTSSLISFSNPFGQAKWFIELSWCLSDIPDTAFPPDRWIPASAEVAYENVLCYH
jgi:hypothetical protein